MSSGDNFHAFEESSQTYETQDLTSNTRCECQQFSSEAAELLRQRVALVVNEELDQFVQSMDILAQSCSYTETYSVLNDETRNKQDVEDELYISNILNEMLTYASMLFVHTSKDTDSECQTILLAQKLIRERKKLEKDLLIQHLIALCGRFNYALSDLSVVVAAYEFIITELSETVEDYKREELLILIHAIAMDVAIPLQLFVDHVQENSSEPDSLLMSNPQPLDRRKFQDQAKLSIKASLCRQNQMFMFQKLIPRICNDLWIKPDTRKAFEHWRTTNTVNSFTIDDETMQAVKMVLQVLSIEWFNIEFPAELVDNLVFYSLFFIHQLLEKEPENRTLLHYLVSINHRALRLLWKRLTVLEHCQPIVAIYMNFVDTYFNSPCFTNLMELLAGALPWFSKEQRLQLKMFSEKLWDCILRLMEFVPVHICVKVENLLDVPITLASPESSSPTPHLDNIEWLETMFSTIPLNMDKQEAEQRQLSRKKKMRNIFLDLLSSVGPEIECYDDRVAEFFKKLQLNNFYEIPRDLLGKSVSPFLAELSEPLQKRLVDECFANTENDSLGTMKFIITYSQRPAYMSKLVIDECIKDLMSTTEIPVLLPQFMDDINFLCFIRSFIDKPTALDYARQLLLVVSNDKYMEDAPYMVERIYHIIYIFFYNSTSDYRASSLRVMDYTFEDMCLSEEELSKIVRRYATISSECPSPALPLFKFPFFTSKELDEKEDVLILSHMFKLIPYITSDLGKQFFTAFYQNSPDIIEKFTSYFEPTKFPEMFYNVLSRYSIDLMKEGLYFYSIYDAALIAISFEFPIDVTMIQTCASLIERVDTFCIYKTANPKKDSTLEKLCNAMFIFRSPLLVDSTRFGNYIREALPSTLLPEISKEDKMPRTNIRYGVNSFFVSDDDYPAVCDYSKSKIISCLMHFRNEIIHYIFSKKTLVQATEPTCDEAIKFFVQVSHSSMTTPQCSEEFSTFLATNEKSLEQQLCYVVGNMMKGVTNCSPIEESAIEVRPLTLAYATTITEFFVDDQFGAHKWPASVTDIVCNILKQCGTKSKMAFLPVHATALKKIFTNKQAKHEPCNALRTILAQNISLLPSWVQYSICPSAFLCEMLPIITELVEKHMISTTELADSIEKCVEFVITPDLIDQLYLLFPLNLQSSDRFLHSRLKFISEPQSFNYTSSEPFASYPLGENRLIFHDALQLLCKFGNVKTHLEILKRSCDNLHKWAGVSDKQGEALKGVRLLTFDEFSIAFRLMVSTALFSYLTELTTYVLGRIPEDDAEYYSDSESIRKMLTRKPVLQSSLNSLENPNSSQPTSYCTYLSSEQQFIQQHWYNCFTCKMVESVGVCSICAMNCHRGHEIVYSKFGPFFCDCGARGCSSLQEGAVNCTPLNACRGRILTSEAPNEANDIKDAKMFEIPENLDLKFETVQPELERLFEEFNNSWDQLENLISGTIQSKQNQWNLDDRRTKAKEAMAVSEMKIKYKQEFMEQTFLGGKHHLNFAATKRDIVNNENRNPNRAKDISGLISLDNGLQLWVISEGSILYIHHINVNENLMDELDTARIDTDPIPFHAKRLLACEEKLAIMGRQDILLYRFGKDGEILDRASLTVEDTLTNPLVKVAWCPGKAGLVAIATLQYVRIFDITQDLTQYVEELVLPVGNVEDMQMFEDSGEVKVLILSSIGHLYQHKVISTTPQNNSFFMTNYFDILGSRDDGSAMSFHYSPTTQLFFVSFEEASYVAAVPKENITKEDISVTWKKLEIESPLYCWQEVHGMITALPVRRFSFIYYFYYKEDCLIIQSANQRKLIPYCHVLLSGADNETVFGLSTYFDNTAVILSRVKWASLPDFWIESMPLRLKTLTPVLNEDPAEDLPREQLPLMMEKCEPIDKVEIHAPDLSKFYETIDLETRLKTVNTWAVTLSQVSKFSITFRVNDSNMIVRAIRIEVPGEKGPNEVKFMNTTMNLDTSSNRFYDILLTRTESLNLDQSNIVLTFKTDFPPNGRTTSTVISIRLYGISRREFGYPKSNTVLKNPLSLPESAICSLTRFFSKAANCNLKTLDQDKMLNIATRLSSFRNAHQEIVTASNHLLRSISGKSLKTYYTIKDRATLQDMAYWMDQAKSIPTNVLAEIVKQIKYMTYTRVGIFFQLVEEELGGPIELLEYLHSQLSVSKDEPQHLLDVYVALTMIFLSSQVGDTKRISQLFLSIFTDDKLSHLSHKVRLIAQTQVYSYSMNTRNDRTISRTLSVPLRVLKWGGLRPFYQKSKIIRPDEASTLTEDLMGHTLSSEELNSTDMFDLEAKFIIDLLNDVLQKIADEGHICSLPKRGTLIRHDAVPATSLLILAIVLMAQLYPTKLYPTVVGLIDMVDWKNPSSEVNEENYRQFLLVRLISVLLTKCGEHIENRKKTDKDDKKIKSAIDDSVTMTLSSPGTPCPELKHDLDDKAEQEDRAANKRRSTERLLDQIATQLYSVGALEYCLGIVKSLIPYWRVTVKETKIVSKLWTRDRSPFITDLATLNGINYGKHGAMDAVEHFYAMITDVALRLPYQMKKISKNVEFSYEWVLALCELVTFHQASQVRRQSKKLLIALCNGDKQEYRTVRDRHLMLNNMELLKKKISQSSNGALSHQHLTEVMELVTFLKSGATDRPSMWREICEKQMNWLMQLACRLSGPVSTQILELLVLAIRDSTDSEKNLADMLMTDADSRGLLKMLLVRYLIGKEDVGRWQLHGMMRSTIQLATRQNQIVLIRILLNELWPLARGLGSHGSQLADLIACYAPRLLNPSELLGVYQTEVTAINDLMKKIEREGHADTYKYTTGLGLGWKFMLMVHSPCLNCFSRKETHESMKLSNIKLDARFSSNAMMIKLLAYYEISKVVIKLSEVKRNKIVKRVNLFYCPKMVESPIELKTNPKLWQKAGTAVGTNGEGEIVISLSLPIVASSLVIQFSEITVSSQDNDLHCPRCSNVVPPNPGVCENCGENAFQCVKCRAINYDERDPFLCQSCGYCKYARMDVSVACRSLPGVQTIGSDAERSNAVEMMSRLLIDIELSKSQLHYGRSLCEALSIQVRSLPVMDFHTENIDKLDALLASVPQLAPSQHSFYGILQVLNFCKNAHEDLCTQTQQLIAYREELRRYDHATSGTPMLLHQAINPGFYSRSSQCFGCICACVLHSMAILQGIAEDASCASAILSDQDSFRKLVKLGQTYDPLTRHSDEFVLRLAFENELGAQRLCELTMEGIIRPQTLAKSILDYLDQFWQMKLKALIKFAIKSGSEDATLSFLMLMDKLLQDGKTLRRKIYRRRLDFLAQRKSEAKDITRLHRTVLIKNESMNMSKKCQNWLESDKRWKTLESDLTSVSSDLLKEHESWFWSAVFSPKIAVRAAASKIIYTLSRQPGHLGISICMLLRGLSYVSSIPAHMTDHFFRYSELIIQQSQQVRIRLFMYGFHLSIMDEIYKECKKMYDEEEQETSMDLDFGLLLRSYTELFCNMLSGNYIEQALLNSARDHILSPLLQSTIFLKRVVFRRTRALDSARFALEALLKRMVVKEPVVLLKTAVESLGSEVLDCYTQAQVVSLIMDVLNPEQQKEEDFQITIEKDPAQEDFLQGRMTGNPYKSSDPGLGPLMRDIKNKICRDTEMVALLEDDNGMELLVNNQIISLSLPVAAVYEKLWRKSHPSQPLIIIYRMRGLLGDAVEPFVNSLNDEKEEEHSDANASTVVEAFIECGGVVISNALISNCNVSTGGRLLLTNLKRLYECIAKSGQGRQQLVKSGAIATFMKVVKLCVDGHSKDESILNIGLEYLGLMKTLSSDANCHAYLGDLNEADTKWLVDMTMRRKQRESGQFPDEWKQFHLHLIPLLGNLVLGSDESEKVLVDECKKTLNWVGIDETQTAADTTSNRAVAMFDVEVLAKVIECILPSEHGKRMKSKILESGVVGSACEHLLDSHPPLYSATESVEWKTFLVKPSLRLLLQFMSSMARHHDPTQLAISEKSLHILHRLEQVASDNSIGTLAENVVEALKENSEVAAKIEAVRLETKQKKRQMAMAMRNKQLSKMGMQIGKSGEVMVAARKIANEPILDEVSDPLSACCICREPVLTGEKVAAAYAFAMCISAESVASTHSTVSQMVLVHIDCHQGAIRRVGGPRNTDEWSKASLHNAGAKCNCMTPIATAAGVASKEWEYALARFQDDLEEFAPISIARSNVFLDMCILIDRFITFGSFSEKSQGGGRESNAQYLAILHLLACTLPTEELSTVSPRWRLYSFLMTELSLESWNEQRADILRAALEDAITSCDRSWSALREICLSWAFVDGYFQKVIPISDADRTDWLRTHILETFQKTLVFVNWFDGDVSKQEDSKSFAELLELDYQDFDAFFTSDEN